MSVEGGRSRPKTASMEGVIVANGGRTATPLRHSGDSLASNTSAENRKGAREKSASVGSSTRSLNRVRMAKAPSHESPPKSASDESRSVNLRSLHPAERRAAQLHPDLQFFSNSMEDSGPNVYAKGPHARPLSSAIRRMSRVATIKKAGIQMRNLQYGAIFSRFSRHSTIHGVCHAALAPSPWWKRFWYIVFTVCLTVLILQVIYLTIKYFHYPKTVDLDLKFENAPFPSVTFCNLNPYKASVIGTDENIKATMDAFQNIIRNTGRNEGIAAAIANSVRRRRRQLRAKAHSSRRSGKSLPDNSTFYTTIPAQRRYLQVYAQCYCEINRLTAERRRGSCFPAYKGKISLSFNELSPLHSFHPTKCLCQLDWITKTVWPCFPYNTWKEHVCTECSPQLGHCPMRFYYSTSKRLDKLGDDVDVCLCHRDYNHCIASNENGEIPEIIPNVDLEQLDFTESFVTQRSRTTSSNSLQIDSIRLMSESITTTTTQAPEIVQAMGFEELKDEIAINAQARENLMFAVEEKPLNERVELSQPKHELILKCSFNQRDCDIDSDFHLHYDPTYGNCFTFNWNRDEAVTAHRVGANYGLRVMLFANVSEYLPTTEAVGFRVTVHDKLSVPFPDAFGRTAPTGFMSSFGVRMKRFERIEPPHGQCHEGGESAETYIYRGYGYSIEGCHRSCTQNEVVRVCGCADPMFPVPDGSKACRVSNPSARDCIKNTTAYLGELIARGKVENCACHQPCRETGYEVSYSAARWPSGTTKIMECEPKDDLCMEKYRKNAAMIEVFYEELNYETLTEAAAYTVPSLMADLGGVIGLWIGISFVSILELIQLFYFCCDAYRRKRRKQSSYVAVHRVTVPSTLPPRPPRSSSHLLNTQKNYHKRSLTTSSTQLYRPISHSSSLNKSNTAIMEEPEELAASKSSSGSRCSADPNYIAPNVDLPCTCLYGSKGDIVFMKPLCPFHGYLVRRGTHYTLASDGLFGDDSDEEEEGKNENERKKQKDAGKRDKTGAQQEASEEEDGMNEQEVLALSDEVARETVEELGDASTGRRFT